VIFKELMQFAVYLGQSMFLTLAGLHCDDRSGGSEKENQGSGNSPSWKNHSQKRQTSSNQQKGNRKMYNRRMQWLRDGYHAQSITMRTPRRKEESVLGRTTPHFLRRQTGIC
jgi:hypothetical protein